MTWRPFDPCKDNLPKPDPVEEPMAEAMRRAREEQARIRVNCTCGASFRTAEDFRDHLPCEGPRHEARSEPDMHGSLGWDKR